MTRLTLALLVGITPLLACDETPRACTLVACAEPSTFTLTLDHGLPLDQGPHQLRVDTELFELRCGVGTSPAGSATCFGFRFTDIDWNESVITIRLVEPFYDADLNPDATPFDHVDVIVSRGGVAVADVRVSVEAGEPVQPNGPACAPTCWQAMARATLP